jgi:uncharacterized Zn finger protein
MKPPRELVIECPVCGDETEHEILGGRVAGRKRLVLRSAVRCLTCGHIHQIEISEEKLIDVPIIISWMGRSQQCSIGLRPSDVISVDDEFYIDDRRVLVTAIEKGQMRVRSAKASEITSIWAKRFDKVWVKISLDSHGKVYSKKILAIPEEEFEVGELFEVEGHEAAVTAIKIEGKTLKKGSAMAKEIIRLYARGIRT